MKQDYRIETLGCTFSTHADEADKNQEKLIKNWKENYPDSEIPESFKNNFNIARALSVMACEIERLKQVL